MIKSKKICALAIVAALVPTAAFAGTSSDSISFGKMVASAKLVCTWSFGGIDKAKARTEFTSSSNTGYSVTSYLEARDSNNNLMGSGVFDKGLQWAECNKSVNDVDSYGSTHTIANSNNIYKDLDLTQLGES